MSKNAWIISAGADTDIDLAEIGIEAKPTRIMAYELSDIGRYLLFPGPIEVEYRLMGCACHYKPGAWKRIKMGALRMMPMKARNGGASTQDDQHLLLARYFVRIPALHDRQLVQHLEGLRDVLRSFEPVVHEIAAIDIRRLKDIRGVCEDEGRHRTFINLSGDLETKRRYILDNLLAYVPITLQHARIAEGLYEMRGLPPENYRGDRRHRLLRFQAKGRFFACLLNPVGKVAFWIDDPDHLHHLLLLQQAIETNPVLKSSLESCLQGDARALRLMLNQEMGIDYSHHRLPPIYRDLFHTLHLDATRQKEIIRSLNKHQRGVSFSYVSQKELGDPQPVTSISVMHDVKALEPLRKDAPQLVAEISRKATLTEAGKYYLLDSIKGRPDEKGL
jgi:hypothetical protein